MKLALVSLIGLLAVGCDHVMAEQVTGSGVSITQKRTVGSFQSIDASGAFNVEVVCQKEVGLELEGDDNLLPLVRTEVRGGTLYIDSEKNLKTRKGIRVRITVPDIGNISSLGANSFLVTNIKNEKLTIEGSGASNIDLSGETVALQLELTGASNADTEKLIASRVTIELSGAGKASVHASQELNATVSGAASISYTGNPATVNRRVSGVSSISKKG